MLPPDGLASLGKGDLDLWGGIECSCVRIGDDYFDQSLWTGHDQRLDDLDLIADLGIRTLRYPILWERLAPESMHRVDWSWAQSRLSRMKNLGIRPIVGLVHHGSGPRYTHLLDPDFGHHLARIASELARRFPWVDSYTPINEPLTTARFSSLYGHWYPHRKSGPDFAKALLNECRATVMAMEAIRKVHPQAKLVQTEDLGTVYSSPSLSYQADFENHRRWITFDLLTANIDSSHPLTDFLQWVGVSLDELKWFQDHPCPPQVIGINHYLTSNRYLDERYDDYPEECRGGNGRDRYVDVEAVRMVPGTIDGPAALLESAWNRYQIPLAITETHLGCTREEQARWLCHVWNEALQAKAKGCDVRAVTIWALLGVFDWDQLMTRPRGYYEPGAFDVRGPKVRSTFLATVARHLAKNHRFDHPILEQPGWWQRDERLLHSPRACQNATTGRPVLIAGGGGTLGRAFARICHDRGIAFRAVFRSDMDLGVKSSIHKALELYQPWAVINATGYVQVDQAEIETERCERENVIGACHLAEFCQELRLPLVSFSSDLVFDGSQSTPYRESDQVNPLNVYGRTKALAEKGILDRHPNSLMIRTSAFFGPWDQANFINCVLETLARGDVFAAVEDVIISPTYVPDLVHACLDLMIDGASGIWHLASPNPIGWADLARMAAHLGGYDQNMIEGRSLNSFQLPAVRPTYSALGSDRGLPLADLECALTRYFQQKL